MTIKKLLIMTYALTCYAIGLVALVAYAGFLAEIGVPKTINSGTELTWPVAVVCNLLLLSLFGIQHSVMARQGFKRMIKRLIPGATERSTYILLSSLVLGVVCWLWVPVPTTIFDVRGTAAGTVLWTLYGFGWAVAVFSTFLIDHFDLFGLKQAWYHWKDRNDFNYSFRTPLLYQLVRHPIYLGWFVIHWFTPNLTVGHALLAAGITVYIYIAIYFEEKDLVREHGQKYVDYQSRIPKLIPGIGGK